MPSRPWRSRTCRRTCEGVRPTRPAGSGTTPPGGTPSLLAAGVRVGRCHDLRLGRQLLRRAPAVDARLLEGEQSDHWDRLGPATPSDPALFSIDDTAEHLRADLEDARQLAAVAASTEPARLGLLLAAESAGALVAAEMTYAGVPWRVEVHERLLTDLLGPRPPRGARPPGPRGAGRRGARGVRRAGSQPRLATRAAGGAAPGRARGRPTPGPPPCARSSTRGSTRCCATSSSRTCSRPTAGPGSTSGSAAAGSGRRTSRPAPPPGGGRPTAAERCPSRSRSGRPPWPTTAGRSWSPTSPSSSRACSPG